MSIGLRISLPWFGNTLCLLQNKKEAVTGFFFHGDLSALVFGFQQFNQLGHSTFLTAHQNFIHQLFDLLRRPSHTGREASGLKHLDVVVIVPDCSRSDRY